MYSNDLTMARGVQGIMDFTEPAGGSSKSVVPCVACALVLAKSDLGSMKRMLWYRKFDQQCFHRSKEITNALVIEIVMEFEVQAFNVLKG